MDQSEIVAFIIALDEATSVQADGNYFFSCTTDEAAQSAHWMPFATLIENDAYDQYSNLNRPGVYRLNIGVSRATFQRLFGRDDASPAKPETAPSTHDYTVLDRIVPHPMYADQHWLSVLSPSRSTFDQVKPLLKEAHSRALNRQHVREQHRRV
jgi:hypothetical protein